MSPVRHRLLGLARFSVLVALTGSVLSSTAFALTRSPEYSGYKWSNPKVTRSGSKAKLQGSFLTDGPHTALKLQIQKKRSGKWKTLSTKVVKARRSGSGAMKVGESGDGTASYETVPRYKYAGAISAKTKGKYRLRAVLTFKEGDEGYFWTARTSSRWKYFTR